MDAHLHDMRQCLEQFHQLRVAVVGDATLAPEVVMIGRDELAEGHAAAGVRTQQVDNLATELIQLVR